MFTSNRTEERQLENKEQCRAKTISASEDWMPSRRLFSVTGSLTVSLTTGQFITRPRPETNNRSHSHLQTKFRVANQPSVLVFGLWEEGTWREAMQTQWRTCKL